MPHKKSKRTSKPRIPYWLISRFYDDLWPYRPRAWRAVRRRVLDPILKRSRTVCELGCGTGTNSIEFARRGLKIFATDYSPEMCRATREKARKKSVNLIVRQADMRTFRLPEPVDLVACEWGPINHLRRKADLAKVARSVARALRPSGYFYFDLHQRRFYEGWAEPIVFDHNRFFLAKQGGYEPSLGCGWMEMTFFIPRASGSWTRHTDLLVLVHWTHAEVVRTLRGAGFKSIQSWHFRDLNSPPSRRAGPGDLRRMYLARKEA